jgi:hypothetical protein
MRKSRPLFIVAAVASALALPASASAGLPQKSYACYGVGNIYISTLKVKSSSSYSYLGDNGKYKFHSGSKAISFTSGALKPWAGRLFSSDDGPWVKLTTDKHGGQTVNCYS